MLSPFSRHASSSVGLLAEYALPVAHSATCYSRAEDVFVHAIVISELKFRHIDRKIFLADLMKRPDHPTFEDRPKALDGVGVDRQ